MGKGGKDEKETRMKRRGLGGTGFNTGRFKKGRKNR